VTRSASSQSGTASSRRRDRGSVRTSLDPDAIADALIEKLHCLQAKRPEYATRNDWYMALAYTVRDRALEDGFFTTGDRKAFRPLVESLLTRDDYLLLADYQSYVDPQGRVSDAYHDQTNWTRMSIINAASVGRFSSDRSIRDYCRDIWNIAPPAPDRGRT
jgi:glucan phosphorylase